MLDYQTALTQLLSTLHNQRTRIEQTPLIHAHGRILAADVMAQMDSPPFDNSAMDGYALCLDAASTSNSFKLIGRIAAGEDASHIQLSAGQALRIFTGAPIPTGCNAIVPQEQTVVDGDTLTCTQAPRQNQFIRFRGEDLRAGDTLLQQGQALNPAAIGLAASQGHDSLPTHAPVRVTVFSSGNELKEPSDNALGAGEIFDANRYQLLAWLHLLGCEVKDGGILPDNRAVTEHCLLAAAEHCDVILTSGGVSVGEEDHLKAALESIGELQQWKLRIKPGKPFAWGKLHNAHVIMLPGNPVSTFVTFKMLVEPAIKVLTGASIEAAKPMTIQAKSQFEQLRTDTRREFLRGQLSVIDGVNTITPCANQGSHMLSACAIANVLIDIPPDTPVAVGDLLAVYPL